MDREQAGEALFDANMVVPAENNTFKIKYKNYIVTAEDCTCMDRRLRQLTCKHMHAVRWYIAKTGWQPTTTVQSSDEFTDVIKYMAGKGNVVNISILNDTFPIATIDKALKAGIIHQTAKHYILMV